jgi:hypothetical protein
LKSKSIAVAIVTSMLISGLAVGFAPRAEAQAAKGAIPAFWLLYLSIGEAQCSLNTGVCTVALANNGVNSSYDLVLESNVCSMDVIIAENSTGTTYGLNGVVGGQILGGVPAGSNVLASCAVPPTRLVYETNGSEASGGFLLKLTNSGSPFPAGSQVGVPFSGVWTNSTELQTVISTSTVISTTTVTEGPSQGYVLALYGSAALLGLAVAAAVILVLRGSAGRRERVQGPPEG